MAFAQHIYYLRMVREHDARKTHVVDAAVTAFSRSCYPLGNFPGGRVTSAASRQTAVFLAATIEGSWEG